MNHKELIDKMDQFAERVLQGGGNVTPQEIAVLPQVLEMLLREKLLLERMARRKNNYRSKRTSQSVEKE